MKVAWSLLLCAWLGVAQAGLIEDERLRLLEGSRPQLEGLNLEAPAWVEDGAFVPVTLRLASAQPPVRLVLLRQAEDDPRIARIRVDRWREPLELSLRLRLPRSQTLEVLARDASGRSWQVQQGVRIAGSSCLAPPARDPLARLGETRAWLRTQESGLELVSLLHHPMESGRRADAQGHPLPRRLIRRMDIEGQGGVLLGLEAFEGLSANPYLRLLLPNGAEGIRLVWEDADGTRYRHAL